MSQAGPSLRPRRASRVPSSKSNNDENAVQQQQQPRLIGKSSTGLSSTKALATKSTNATIALGTTSTSNAAGPSKAAAPRRALGDVSNAIRGAVDRAGKDGKPSTRLTTAASSSRAASQQQQQLPSSTSAGFSRLTIGPNGGRSSRPPSRADALTSEADAPPAAVGLGIRDVKTHHDDEIVEIVVQAPSSAKKRTAAEEFGDISHIHEPDHKVRIVDHAVDPDHDNADDDEDDGEFDWVVPSKQSKEELQQIKGEFEEQLDYWDTTMVAEYSDEIFQYMAELEVKSMPNPRYMDHQTEIEWSMRTTLIDWLLQVHMRYHMLPETLWIAINVIDRFLSNRVVSLAKFQLVGVTAMFIAAKYEEIMAPSVEEFVYMTEGGYSREEILKGERIILQSLEFNISSYCSPYSWVRRISKADDYDLQTRTLSKFLMEVTLLDHRFLRAKPSMIAAIGMFLARKMLGGTWDEAFIFYSDYTEEQLTKPANYLMELINAPDFDQKFVYKKYAVKKFLKASVFARNYAREMNGELP